MRATIRTGEAVSSHGRRSRVLALVTVVLALACARHARVAPVDAGYGPGARSLLDAHNAYPERGLWTDRIDRALATGVPLAIEQDLHWRVAPGSTPVSVVAHDTGTLDGAPTLRESFFERVRPIMERALGENRRERWPLIVLNLDFKDSVPAHLASVLALLREHDRWLTTAPRTAAPERPEPLVAGPLLVLTGSAAAQRRVFHDAVPVGDRLRLFGAMPPAPVTGTTGEERSRRAIAMTAAEHIDRPADNWARWVNFPWSVVEAGGQRAAGPWTPADAERLQALVARAHAQGFWIRFYTLDGFPPEGNRGYTASYNFGTLAAARLRWEASLDAGVDFVATDQYEALAALRARRRSR